MCVCTFCFSGKINEVIYFPEKLLEAQLSPSSATHQKTSHDSFAQNVKQVDYTPQLHRERKEVTLVLRDVCVSLPSFSSLVCNAPVLLWSLRRSSDSYLNCCRRVLASIIFTGRIQGFRWSLKPAFKRTKVQKCYAL